MIHSIMRIVSLLNDMQIMYKKEQARQGKIEGFREIQLFSKSSDEHKVYTY